MSAIELVDVEKKAEAEMAPVLAKAAAFAVIDERSYVDADLICTEIKLRVKEREFELLPVKESATKTWKDALALWKKFIDEPLAAVKTLDRKRYQWRKAEDKRRQDEAEALRREQAKKDAEAKLELATRMEAAGMGEQAEKVLAAPVAPTTVPSAVSVSKPAGQTQSENWTARVIDASLVPREFLIPDLVALGKYARLMKAAAVTPGVVYEDVGKTSRRMA